MHTLRLQSLNVKPADFLRLMYHATGLGFVFEWETLQRPVVFTAEEFERRQTAVAGVLDSAMRACANVRIETQRIFPDEARLAPDELHPRDKIFREEVETALEFLRLLRKHDVSPNVKDLGDMPELRRASPPLADWLAGVCRANGAGGRGEARSAVSLLANAAAVVNTRFPQLGANFEAAGPGVFGVQIRLGPRLTAFITKDDGRWRGTIETRPGGTSVTPAADLELPEQPDPEDSPNLAYAIMAAAGLHLARTLDFAPGRRVELTYGVDRHPDFFAPAGLRGAVEEFDLEARKASVKLDDHLAGCEEWNNCVVWDMEQFYDFALEVRRI